VRQLTSLSSSFGLFHAALDPVRSFLPFVDWRLPRVVVVGCRNAGKSSILENVTKCSIFPRSAQLCTKRPIVLKLKQAATQSDCSVTVEYKGPVVTLESTDAILHTIEGIMQGVDDITSEEIVVEICQVCFSSMPSCVAILCLLTWVFHSVNVDTSCASAWSFRILHHSMSIWQLHRKFTA